MLARLDVSVFNHLYILVTDENTDVHVLNNAT